MVFNGSGHRTLIRAGYLRSTQNQHGLVCFDQGADTGAKRCLSIYDNRRKWCDVPRGGTEDTLGYIHVYNTYPPHGSLSRTHIKLKVTHSLTSFSSESNCPIPKTEYIADKKSYTQDFWPAPGGAPATAVLVWPRGSSGLGPRDTSSLHTSFSFPSLPRSYARLLSS